MTDLVIRPFQKDDFEFWLPLWSDYQQTEIAKLDQNETRKIFDFLVSAPASTGLLLFYQGIPAGFTHLHAVNSTTGANTTCYMKDLIVLSRFRGQQLGKALIDASIAYAKEKGYIRFFWITKPENKNAHRLYDHYASPKDWLRYVVAL